MVGLRGFALRLGQDRRGLSSTELGVVLALIALGSVQALSMLGKQVEGDLDTATSKVADNRPNADPFARRSGQSQNGQNAQNGGSDGSEPSTAGGSAEPPPAPDGWDSGGEEPPIAASMPMDGEP